MTSEDIEHPRINWPSGGRNSRFMVLNIPSMTMDIVDKCLAFISSNCCYVSSDRVKRFITIQGMKSNIKSSDPIQLEHFLAEVVEHSNLSDAKIDYSRYQSGPNDSSRLLQCPSIKRVVQLTETIVNKQISPIDSGDKCQYVVTKVTVLFSKPGGCPQELHCDDRRDEKTRTEEGEMLSAIVALQDNTRLDVEGDNRKRLTYSIPPTSMILFSGQCKHGGSSYNRFNVRLHMYLMPKETAENTNFDPGNVIVVDRPCPIKDCEHSKEGETFSQSQLYRHWHKHHRNEIGLSVGKFVKELRGIEVLHCELCRKGFNTKRGLARHKKHKCRVRKSLR